MDTDDQLRAIGSFGKYQRIVVFFIILPAVLPSAFHSFNQMFLAAQPDDFWCKVVPDVENYNMSPSAVHSILPPAKPSELGSASHSRCEMYDLDYADLMNSSLNDAFNFTLFGSLNTTRTVPCKFGYQYERSVYSSSIVTEWDLVCDKDFFPTISLVLLQAGEILGPPVFGYLSDQIGRKKPYLLCFFIQTVFGISTAFAPNFVIFCVFRVIVGGTYGAVYSLPFILGLEIVGPDHRATVCVLASITYSIGYIILGGIAYMVRDWQQLALYTSAPLVIIGFAWCFVPESPRWLLAKGRVEEAKSFFKEAAKINGVELDQRTLDAIVKNGKKIEKEKRIKRHTFVDLFRTPNLRRNTLLLTLVNSGNLAVYSGLSYYGPALSPAPHLAFLLSGLVELPGYLFVQFTADRYGRRMPQIGCMMVGGVACIAAVTVPASASDMYMVFCLMGKLFITVSYNIAELMEGELIPTVVRSEGSAFTEIVASAVTTCVPLIVYLGYDYLVLPLIIFGVLACVAGVCAFFLPETFDADLPETIEDGEKFGKEVTFRERFNLFPRKRKRRLLATVMSDGAPGEIVKILDTFSCVPEDTGVPDGNSEHELFSKIV